MLMRTRESTHNALLQLERVVWRLGAQGFGPFTLQVTAGERIAILGPSGAGKSSLLKMLAREYLPASGEIQFKQRPLASWSVLELSQQRAVLPQSGEVAFGLASELVIGLGRVARQHDPQLPSIVKQAAQMAHAGHLLGRRFDTLSGGEQARVQLARIFAQLWDVTDGLILVDEPLSALDPGLQCELLESLDTYATARNHALIAILHDMNQALQGSERLWLLKDGVLLDDLASSSAALPALEVLYGVSLRCVTSEDGEVLIFPRRKAISRGAPAMALAGQV